MTTVETKAQRERRLARFAWNLLHAKWGRFPITDSGNPVICGVCGAEYEDQMSKADHLRSEHDADVWVVGPPLTPETMYEWQRI